MRTAIACAASVLAFGQVQETGFRVVSEVRLVVLDVGVRDRNRQPVTGLGRESFRVFDSGRPKDLAAFAREDAPVSIGLAVDTSASMRAKRAEAIAAVRAFKRESNPADETFLVTFNDDVDSDAVNIEGALMQGRTKLFDGIDAALRRAEAGSRERKALVVISDGADTASRLTEAQLLRRARLALVTVYAIGLFDEAGADSNPGFLRAIARATGGEARVDIAPGDLPRVCAEIARDIRSRYMLAFRAAEAAKEETRSIRVEVSLPGGTRAKALARRSYVATPIREAKP